MDDSSFSVDKERLNAEVNRRIATQWKILTPEEKHEHIEKAEADKLRYEREMKEYNTQTSSSSATVLSN